MAIVRLRVNGNDSAAMERIGLQLLSDSCLVSEEIPASLATDPHTCPYAYTSCFGAKDPEFETRCSGRNLPYLNCRSYQLYTGEKKLKVFRDNSKRRNRKVEVIATIHDPLEDTVVMRQDELVELNHPPKYDASLHDRIADGEDPKKSGWFLRAVGGVE